MTNKQLARALYMGWTTLEYFMSKGWVDRIDDAKFWYYEGIARIIADNPTVSLPALRAMFGVTHHEMWKAQEMFRVRRKTGKGSQAYRKATTNS